MADISDGENIMTMSKTTRTHLIYQFIIFTLLFLSIGYNELLPDRKFIIFLAFLPIFSYQLLILCCCMELMPVPSWMSFLQPVNATERCYSKVENFEDDFEQSSSKISSHTQTKNISFPEVNEPSPYMRRREKSVTNLRVPPKNFDYAQKSKSWVNLCDSKSTERLSREGSLDTLESRSEKKLSSKVLNRADRTRNREDRAAKAKSWKPDDLDFDISERSECVKRDSLSMKEHTELPSLRCTQIQHEESELAKSYSFPFRQKRLETWLEMKETNLTQMDRSPGMPYWQTVGYNLAVKYEARRRRRAISSPTKSGVENEEQSQKFQKSVEIVPENASSDKVNPNSRKPVVKSASACMNKIKVGFSNLISKKKEEGSESSSSANPNKVSKSALLFKLKNKNISGQTKEKDKELTAMPEFPQFLSNERPLIFYPKYIPFEKERFESDVKKKMIELSEEQKAKL